MLMTSLHGRKGRPYGEHLVRLRMGIEERAAASLSQRRANGEVMTYIVDGWVVREWPNQRIEAALPGRSFYRRGLSSAIGVRELIVYAGPNGSGKSSLRDILDDTSAGHY